MARMIRTAIAAVVAALTIAAPAHARGGDYEIVGATPSQAQTVREALDASTFDWSLIPRRITVRVLPSLPSEAEAVPGEVRIAAGQLDLGRIGWWIIQHEFAHQVDYFLLTDAQRAELLRLFGLDAWRGDELPHRMRGAEVFASSLAWAFWPNLLNGTREEATVDIRGFRLLLAKWGLAPPPEPVCRRMKVKRGYWHTRPHGKFKKKHWHRPVYRVVCR